MNIFLKSKLLLAVFVSILIIQCRQNGEIANNSNSTNSSEVTKEEPQEEVPKGEDEVFDLTQFGIDDKALIPTGLKKGERAPDFSGVDQNGSTVSLSQLLQKGPVVLQFYRGSWCPVCTRYYSAISDSLPMIRSNGASFIAVSPEMSEHNARILRESGADFQIVGDPDHEIMKGYDVMFKVLSDYDTKIKEKLKTDIAAHNGSSDSYLPIPATYVIDQKGRIQFVQFNYNYRKRASAATILKALRSL